MKIQIRRKQEINFISFKILPLPTPTAKLNYQVHPYLYIVYKKPKIFCLKSTTIKQNLISFSTISV